MTQALMTGATSSETNFGLFAARANGGGTASFAHVGGFLFGVIVARVLVSSGVLRAGPRQPAAVGAAP
jgi:membrane associated rhomboid family serine protease